MINSFWNVFENLCNKKGQRPNPVGKEIGVASSTIAKWKSGTIPNGDTLIQIADYFDVSVDYLLGRTDNPNSIHQDNNSGNIINGSNGNNSPLTVNGAEQLDEMTAELVKAFRSLPFRDRLDVINMVMEKSSK